jgi:hypothetical protein
VTVADIRKQNTRAHGTANEPCSNLLSKGEDHAPQGSLRPSLARVRLPSPDRILLKLQDLSTPLHRGNRYFCHGFFWWAAFSENPAITLRLLGEGITAANCSEFGRKEEATDTEEY